MCPFKCLVLMSPAAPGTEVDVDSTLLKAARCPNVVPVQQSPAVSGLLQTNLPTFPRGWLGPVSAGAGSEPFKTR